MTSLNRRSILLLAGLLFGFAIGLAFLEGVPETKDPAYFVSELSLSDNGTEPFQSNASEYYSTLTPENNGDGSTTPPIGISIGNQAPDFALEDLDGELVGLSDHQGEVVLINFWATWCGPCRVEMRAFQTKFEAHQADGFTVLAVNFDEPESDVREFGEELGVTFSLLMDPGAEVQRLYQVIGYPSSVIVDEEGIIQVIHIGLMTEGQLEAYLVDLGVGS